MTKKLTSRQKAKLDPNHIVEPSTRGAFGRCKAPISRELTRTVNGKRGYWLAKAGYGTC
jgi:hypothetical protein